MEDRRFFCPDGRKLFRLRKAKGLTQKDLAAKAGPAKRTIESAEKGRPIRLSNAMEIAVALGVALTAFERPISEGDNLGTSVPPADRPPSSTPSFRIVAFDLDGTLLRGMEFSWELVWKHLGYDDKIRRDGMQRYLQRSSRWDGFTYAQWCVWCYSHFSAKGLSRRHLKEIASQVMLTRNFYPTVEILKATGHVLALISGGIDTFLYEVIPDADRIFDHIFINKMIFDAQDALVGIEPTAGDFEGKRAAIEQVCAHHDSALAQTVFVGDNLNDEYIIETKDIGLRIAYNAHSPRVRALADVVISDDDLSLVIPHIVET